MQATLKRLSTTLIPQPFLLFRITAKQRKGNEKVKYIDITSISTHITPKYFFIHRRIKEKIR
jgi:hypothetical protein